VKVGEVGENAFSNQLAAENIYTVSVFVLISERSDLFLNCEYNAG
jgi:hypothetical protein